MAIASSSYLPQHLCPCIHRTSLGQLIDFRQIFLYKKVYYLHLPNRQQQLRYLGDLTGTLMSLRFWQTARCDTR